MLETRGLKGALPLDPHQALDARNQGWRQGLPDGGSSFPGGGTNDSRNFECMISRYSLPHGGGDVVRSPVWYGNLGVQYERENSSELSGLDIKNRDLKTRRKKGCLESRACRTVLHMGVPLV